MAPRVRNPPWPAPLAAGGPGGAGKDVWRGRGGVPGAVPVLRHAAGSGPGAVPPPSRPREREATAPPGRGRGGAPATAIWSGPVLSASAPVRVSSWPGRVSSVGPHARAHPPPKVRFSLHKLSIVTVEIPEPAPSWMRAPAGWVRPQKGSGRSAISLIRSTTVRQSPSAR